jgi:hypothetical protein
VKLALYSSVPRGEQPNLVSIQHPQFAIATELVCPLRREASLTSVRTVVTVGPEKYIVLCELARPVDRRALRRMGELSEAESSRVLETFVSLLAV